MPGTLSVPLPVAQPSTERSAPNRPYLSNSAIATYQRCPLQFYYRYVARQPPEFTASSLLFGTAMHAALAKLQDLRLAGAEAVELEELLPVYDEAWKREQPAPVKFNNGETADALRQLAARMLTHALGAQGIQPPGRTVAIEHTERRDLPGQPFDLLGRFDLLSVHDDALIITDFKTSRARWSTVGPDDLQQLLLYAWILAPLARALELEQIRMRWVVLIKTRTPAIQIVEQEPGRQAVQRLLRVVERIAAAIAGCHWYPVPSKLNCGRCPYQTACRKWGAS